MKQRVQLITATTGAEVEAVAKKVVSVEEESEEAKAVLNDSGMDRSKRVLNDDRSSNHGQLCMTVGGSGSEAVSERIM